MQYDQKYTIPFLVPAAFIGDKSVHESIRKNDEHSPELYVAGAEVLIECKIDQCLCRILHYQPETASNQSRNHPEPLL